LPGYFESKRQPSDSGTTTPATPATTLTPGGTKRRPIFKRTKSKTPGSKKNSKDFNFDASQQRDVLGIVILEIKGATDLPKLKNGRVPLSSGANLS
jgi:phosphatidylserine decarboxylase